MIVLDLPLPPPLSSLTTNSRNGGGRPSTKRYNTWKRAAGNEINASKRSLGQSHIPGRTALTIVLSFEDLYNKDGSESKVRQDVSNRVKALEDIIVEHGFIDDDSLIDDLHVYRSHDMPRGRVRLFVKPCNLFHRKEKVA